MKLTDVRDALLLALPGKVYHYTAPHSEKEEYIVWAEDSQGQAVHAGNCMYEQAIEGTIDLYTKEEFSKTFAKIQKALALKGISYRYNSTQYEEKTGFIHHEWVFEVESYA